MSYEPECITTDTSPLPTWGVPRLVRFDNECVVIPESEWFAHADSPSGDHSGHGKSGLKAVFGLNKMKKVVMVNRSYSLPLWPTASSANSGRAQEDETTTGESGTEDEAPHQRKVVRLNFKVPIPKFTPEKPHNASRHPHLRSPSVEYPAHALPHVRGRRDSRSRSPPPSGSNAIPISPILIHRSLSPEVSRSPNRGFAPGTSPPQFGSPPLEHHPHNALYTNPRLDTLNFPSSSSPPRPGMIRHASSSNSSSSALHATSPPMDPSIFAVLPELVPLRPCCPDCSHTLEDALQQGEDWKEKFTKGARRRRRRSSSAASNVSVASSVVSVDGATGEAPTSTVIGTTMAGASGETPTMVLHPALEAVPVVTTVKRPSLTVSTVPVIPTTCVEETDEEMEMEMEVETEPESSAEDDAEGGAVPLPGGKLTLAVVDEVEGLKRRSLSGSSLNRLSTTVTDKALPEIPVAASNTSSDDSISDTQPPVVQSFSPKTSPRASPRESPRSSPRAFLDVPQESSRGFRNHGRIASGGSVSSISSEASGSGNESSGSGGSRGSVGSSGSRRPGKSILKNSPSNSPLPSPSLTGSFPIMKGPPRTAREKEMERRREREENETVMVNTLMNMNMGGSSRGRSRRVPSNGSSHSRNGSIHSLPPSPGGTRRRSTGTTIDLGGKKKGLCEGDDYFGSAKCEDDDEDGLFPLPRSPRISPNGSPNGTARPSNATTPRGSNTPEQLLTPRGGSPRVSPRHSPYASPRNSPKIAPSPLAVTSPVVASKLEVEQGDVNGELLSQAAETFSRHARAVSEPFPSAAPVSTSRRQTQTRKPPTARKNSGSFSFGRGLRALGADMVKGLGNMGGMSGGSGTY